MRNEPKGILGSAKNKHHFAVFLSNNGYLEVIAEGFDVLEPYEGKL